MKERHTVNPVTGCWVWQGAKTSTGYGAICVERRVTPAHRAYYEHFVGPIPEGMQLHHRCEVRACVNPEHLEPIMRAAHMRLHNSSLTAETAHEIRESQEPAQTIALRYGITPSAVRHIRRGGSWADETTVIHPASYYRTLKREQADARLKRMEELWQAGLTIEAIAAELGWKLGLAAIYVHRAREAGFDLPYRRSDGKKFAHCLHEAAA